MTRRPLVSARATKPLRQTRSLDEVVPAAAPARIPPAPDPDLQLFPDRRRMDDPATPGDPPGQPDRWPTAQARPARDHRRHPLPGAQRLLPGEFPPWPT